MKKTIKKVLSIILTIMLLINLLYVALGRINDLVFWLNLMLLFVIYYIFFGDREKLKKHLMLNN